MFKKILSIGVSYSINEIRNSIDAFCEQTLREAWELGLNSKKRLEYRDYKLSLYGIEI